VFAAQRHPGSVGAPRVLAPRALAPGPEAGAVSGPLYCTTQHSTVLYCTKQHITLLYCTALHYAPLATASTSPPPLFSRLPPIQTPSQQLAAWTTRLVHAASWGQGAGLLVLLSPLHCVHCVTVSLCRCALCHCVTVWLQERGPLGLRELPLRGGGRCATEWPPLRQPGPCQLVHPRIPCHLPPLRTPLHSRSFPSPLSTPFPLRFLPLSLRSLLLSLSALLASWGTSRETTVQYLYCTLTVLYCTALYCAVLCCAVLYCTVLCCTVLYSTQLCHNCLCAPGVLLSR